MGIILAILLFSLIIIIHELGHFTLAKLNGIRVDEFSLGMGPTLFGKEFKGTKFSLKLLPLGGACMMGEDDADDTSEGSFNSKSVWARISVIAAGPLFNFILALLMSAILVGAAGYAVPVIQEVESGSSGSEQGLKKGDVITEINGKKIHIYEEFQLYNLTHSTSDTAELTFERDGKEHTIQMEKRQFGDETTKRMGFTYSAEVEKPGFFKSIQYGAYTAKYWVEYTLECLKMLLMGEVGVNQLSGPVGIVEVVNDSTVRLVGSHLKYDEPGNSDLSQLRCHEPASNPSTGWRASGISSDRGGEKKTDRSGERRYGAFYWICSIDGTDGVCDV